jgi:hypothetical protein
MRKDRKKMPATIVRLLPEMVVERMGDSWWADPMVTIPQTATPVDLDWDWYGFADFLNSYPGEQAIAVAVVTADNDVQGAMLVSTSKEHSSIDVGGDSIKIEGICTAPRNREDLVPNGEFCTKASA